MQTVEPLKGQSAVGPSDYEKERGKPMPNYSHGIIQANVTVILGLQAGTTYRIASELTCELPDGSVFTPDISVLMRRPVNLGREPARCREVPVLAVEILSPSQGHQSVVEKIDAYFANGVQSVWEINPALRLVAVYQPGANHPEIFLRGEVKDSATNLIARVEEIFA